jgi:hypothetical protein
MERPSFAPRATVFVQLRWCVGFFCRRPISPFFCPISGPSGPNSLADRPASATRSVQSYSIRPWRIGSPSVLLRRGLRKRKLGPPSRPSAGDPAGEDGRGDDPDQGMAGDSAERRSFRSRGDRPLRASSSAPTRSTSNSGHQLRLRRPLRRRHPPVTPLSSCLGVRQRSLPSKEFYIGPRPNR